MGYSSDFTPLLLSLDPLCSYEIPRVTDWEGAYRVFVIVRKDVADNALVIVDLIKVLLAEIIKMVEQCFLVDHICARIWEVIKINKSVFSARGKLQIKAEFTSEGRRQDERGEIREV